MSNAVFETHKLVIPAKSEVKIPRLGGDIVTQILYPTTVKSEMDEFKNLLIKIRPYDSESIKTIKPIDVNLLNCLNMMSSFDYVLDNTLDRTFEVVVTYGFLKSRNTLHNLWTEPIVATTTNVEYNEIDFVINNRKTCNIK